MAAAAYLEFAKVPPLLNLCRDVPLERLYKYCIDATKLRSSIDLNHPEPHEDVPAECLYELDVKNRDV
jgi:hypothetical protein